MLNLGVKNVQENIIEPKNINSSDINEPSEILSSKNKNIKNTLVKQIESNDKYIILKGNSPINVNVGEKNVVKPMQPEKKNPLNVILKKTDQEWLEKLKKDKVFYSNNN